jgi:uncharacterized DUF497 family protein
MSSLGFEWDTGKAIGNLRKHGVLFEEAATVFYDEYANEFDDPDHSVGESRFILLGISRNLRVLIVIFCHRNANTIRIISARKANKKETHYYFRSRRA